MITTVSMWFIFDQEANGSEEDHIFQYAALTGLARNKQSILEVMSCR